MTWDNVFISWNLFSGFGFLMVAIHVAIEGRASFIFPLLLGLFFFSVWSNWHYNMMGVKKK